MREVSYNWLMRLSRDVRRERAELEPAIQDARRTRRAAVDELAGSLVRVSGTVMRDGPPLIAPISKRACVFWQLSFFGDYVVGIGLPHHWKPRRWKPGALRLVFHRVRWRRIPRLDSYDGVPFSLVGKHGTSAVVPIGCNAHKLVVSVKTFSVWELRPGDVPSDEFSQVFMLRGPTPPRAPVLVGWRIREDTISIGDRIAAVGVARSHTRISRISDANPYRGRPAGLCFDGRDGSLLLADDDQLCA